jgi:hypothetical protein
MRNAKRTQAGIVSVDGQDFEWRLHREPQWCTVDGWRGLVLAMRHVDGQRQALLEWPMPKGGSNSVPYRNRPKIDSPLLIGGVRSALAAGWKPLSKGRDFRLLVEE